MFESPMNLRQLDRTGADTEIDGDIVSHIPEEKDRWPRVLTIETMIEDTQVFIAIFVNAFSIDHLSVTFQVIHDRVHRLDSDSTSSARPIAAGTSWCASPIARAGLEQA